MQQKIKLAIIFGGVSSEHDISLISASSVIKNTPADKYDITTIGITRDGRWLLYNGETDKIADGEWVNGDCTPCVISPDRATHGVIIMKNNKIVTQRIDVVFPVLHGKNGEDGTIQGLLELAGIPYVGCSVLGSSLCMDKIAANMMMDAAGIARCEWAYTLKSDNEDFDALEKRLCEKLDYPIFVKPANAGSSVGITKAHNKAELYDAVQLAFKHDSRILFERFVDGQEIECAVCGNDNPISTLPGEIIASKEFYDFDDKYKTGTSSVVIPAHLSDEKLHEAKTIAEKAYRALCCRGLSRVDFFVERSTGKVLLNEINTMPGFTSISMYPKLMTANGTGYGELIDKLITLAIQG